MRYMKLSVLAFATILLCGYAAIAVEQQTTTASEPGATGQGAVPVPGKKKIQPVPQASMVVECGYGGKKFKISTGTGTGQCSVDTDADNYITGGQCLIGDKLVASFSCSGGCSSAAGKGTCTPVN